MNDEKKIPMNGPDGFPGGPGGFPGGPDGFLDGPGGPGGPGGPDGSHDGPEGPGGDDFLAMLAKGFIEKKPDTDWVLEESVVFPKGVVLYEGSLPAAGEGKALLMTVDGVVTEIKPGTYPGKVVLTVYTLTNVPKSQGQFNAGDHRTALFFMDGKQIPTGIEAAAGDYTVSGNTVSGIRMITAIDEFNGIIVGGETESEQPLVIRDSVFCMNGSGSSVGMGAAVSVVGKGNLKLENVEFWDYGTLTAVIASGNGKLEVADSVIYGARDFTKGKQCPWVLGINGSNRLTNAIDSSRAYYHDSIVVAQSWAALSTDAGSGVRLVGENMFAGIGRLEPYDESHASDYTATPEVRGKKFGFYLGNSSIGECGYINYADTGFHNSFKNVEFWSPDYLFILSTTDASIDVSGDSRLYSGRFGVLLHKNQEGTVSFTGGKVHAERALYLVKSWAESDPDGCYPHGVVDGAEVTLGSGGVLYQLMTSDDSGLTPGKPSSYTVPEIEADLSKVPKLPETYRTQKVVQGFPPHVKYPVFTVDGQEITVKEDVDAFLKANPSAEPTMYDASYRLPPATFTLKNTAATGDVFNGVWGRIQVLDVTLENASLTGTVSSAYTYHVDEEGNPCAPGTTYQQNGKEDEHLGIGRVGNTPAPSINNPVHLTIRSGASWTPAAVSYLDELTVEPGCTVNGCVTVDGTPVSLPGAFRGAIVVKP